jgi:hypothetical protein
MSLKAYHCHLALSLLISISVAIIKKSLTNLPLMEELLMKTNHASDLPYIAAHSMQD